MNQLLFVYAELGLIFQLLKSNMSISILMQRPSVQAGLCLLLLTSIRIWLRQEKTTNSTIFLFLFLFFSDIYELCDIYLQGFLNTLHILPSRKKPFTILKDVSGIVKPCRMTLLLGPPSSGKTTLLLALAGKLDPNLKVNRGLFFFWSLYMIECLL